MQKEGERPDENGKGVQEPGQVEVEQRRRQKRQEQPVFESPLQPADRGGLPDLPGDEIQYGAERADPAAEKSAENSRKYNDQETGEEQRHPSFQRQHGARRGQRIG